MKNNIYKETEISFTNNNLINFFTIDGVVGGYTNFGIMKETKEGIFKFGSWNVFEVQFSTVPDLLGKDYQPIVAPPKNLSLGKLYMVENSHWLNHIDVKEEHQEEMVKIFSRRDKDKTIEDYRHFYIGSKKEHLHVLAIEIHLKDKPSEGVEPLEEEYQRVYSPFIQKPDKYQINEKRRFIFPDNIKNLYKFYINTDKKYVNIEPSINSQGMHNSMRVVYYSEKNMLIMAHLGTQELLGNSLHDVGHTFIFDKPVFLNKTAKYAYDKDFPEYYWEGLIYEYPNSPLLKYFKGKNYRHFIMPFDIFSFRDIVAVDYKIVSGVTSI